MAMQLRCRCGANLSADPNTASIVCGACGATVAVPQPERELGLSETVPALPQQRAPTPPPVAPPSRSALPIVIGALAVVAIGIVLVVVATRGDGRPAKPQAAPVTAPADATMPDGDEPPRSATSPEELVVLERAAIGRADAAALLALMSPTIFVHGPDAKDLAYDAATAAPLVRSLGGAIVESTWSKIAIDKNVAWIVDELDVGGVKLLTSQLAFRDGGTWRVAAWHLARLVPNKQAYELAKAFRLPIPNPLEEHTDDDRQVHAAFTSSFATREAFIEAFSERADAIDLGSAPGERVVTGKAVKRAFRSIDATFEVVGPVAAGRVDERVGWAAGNVGFGMEIAGERVQQTFRVLAVFVREQTGWKIVLAQWSNAGPIP